MRIIQFTKIFVFALLYLLSGSGLFVIHAQQIQPADPVSISADDFMGPFTTLQNGPVLTETAPGQINMGFIEFRAPSNFVWDTEGPLPTVNVTLAPGFNGNTSLEVVFVERTANLLRFQVVTDSDNPPRRAGRATFGNFRLRPANGTIGTFNVTVTSASTALAAGSTSFGEVTKTTGADSIVRVETKPDGTGTLAGSHELTAGNSITVYSVVRDQFNNFKSNQDAEWDLNITSGNIVQSDINPDTGFNSSAVLTGNRTGTAEIISSIAGLTPVNSGEIEVVPAAPAKIVISEQTGDTTYAAGDLFDPYVIELRDNFENVVNDGVNRSVTVNRNAGEGTLQGTTSVSTTSGVFNFTNLFITKSNEIDLRFSLSGFADVISESITIIPDQADGLIFTQQPTTTNRQETINPFPRVQIIDQFGNFRTDEGVSISLNLFRVDTNPEQGANFTGGSTTSVLTNANGAAVFENLAINQPQNVVREYRIEAVHDDVTVSTGSSNSFAVVEGGALARFTIREDNGNGGTAITDKTAGEPIDLVLRAETSDGTLVDDFDGSVTISTTGQFDPLVQTTINFTAGEAAHTIALIKSGLHSLSVDNDDGPQIGTSNEFTINPDDADPAKSVVSANPGTVIANGSSASTITVQLMDQFENLLTGGGDTVEITTTAGVFSDDGSSTLSNGDQTITGTSANGKFTAQITSNDVSSAAITAKVNTLDFTESTAGVEFTFGGLTNFRIEDAGTTGGEITSPKTAGTPFNIKITAFDDFNNVVTDFDGTGATVVLTTSGVFGQGQQTTTGTFTQGVLETFAVTIITSGSQTITARRSGFTEQTTSNSFQLDPAAPDPATSVISSEFAFLENNGTATSEITVTLNDQFNNNITRDNDNISVEFTEPVNSSLSPVDGLTTSGTFTSVLTAGMQIEDVTIEAFIEISGDNFSIGTVTVSITEVNEWTSTGGGQPAGRRNWDNAANWLLGVPTTGQIVIIPTNPVNAAQFPRISDSNPVIDFLVIQQDATINVENGITLTVNENISGNGALIGDNSIFNFGGNITVSNITAGTSLINLTSSSHLIGSSTNFVGNIINIGNTVSSVVTGNGYLEAATRIDVAAGSSLIMDAGSELVLINEIIIEGDLTGNESVFSFGGNVDATGANISLNDTNIEFNGETVQTVNGFSPINNLTINNQQEVIYQSDLTVTGTLSLVNGFLTILSGNNLVANNKSGTLSNIRMQREITGNAGWRVISSPLNTSFDNLLDNTITQGFPGANLSDTNPLQPNVLWYNESVSGTDNQRWRTPANASNNVTAGRGYFVYFFDEAEVDGDERYDQFTTGDFFPYLLEVDGTEFDGNGTEVILPVTYTAEADTGWNLVGNPFAATVDWDDGTWQKTNMDNTIYVWDESANQYLYWNGVAGTLGTGRIAPFQGFWVKANGNGTPSLRVRKSSKTTGGTFKKEPDRYDNIPVIALKLNSDFYSTATHLTFTKDGSFNVDPYDAYRLLPFQTDTYLEIFSLFKDGTELAINNLPRDFGKPIEIPVHAGGIKNGAYYSGPVTISWPELDNIPEGWTIELVDKFSNTRINLQNEEFYSFELSTQNKAKAPPRMNRVDNFQLLNKAKETAQNARFVLIIDPGDDAGELPREVTLNQNFPNPFNPATTIKFGLPVEDRVRIDVYDILGRRVQTIANERFGAGFHEVRFEGSSLASGVYIYRLITSEKVLNKKMTLIK